MPMVAGRYQSRSIYLSAFSEHLLNVRPWDFQMGDIVIFTRSQMCFSASSLRSTAQRAREGGVLWSPHGLHSGALSGMPSELALCAGLLTLGVYETTRNAGGPGTAKACTSHALG